MHLDGTNRMSSPRLSDNPIELVVAETHGGCRLDRFLTEHFLDYSRVHLRRVISAGGVRIDGRGAKPSYRLRAGQSVRIVLPELPREAPRAENIPLEFLYQDDAIAVVNKPPGMVVHPARGHWTGTLAGALAYHLQKLSGVGGPARPGIVHRLDRDTSGVIVVAKTDLAHRALSEQFAERTVRKEYFAVLSGAPDRDRDYIDRPIGVHPCQREKMAVRTSDSRSRQAVSFFEVVERFRGFCTAAVFPKTGRTHQIRVHLASIGCAVLCDRQYGGRSQITLGEIRREPPDGIILLARQALHARCLTIQHPDTREAMMFEAPLPTDLTQLLVALREYRGDSGDAIG